MSEVVKINNYDIKDLKAVRTYDNVAAMKSDTKLRVGQHVKTKGYYTAGDGGSAEYIIKSSSSGYYEELTNELVAELIINDSINVKQCGATGDGTTDDTNSIQVALNNFQHIMIPNGTYLVTDNLTLHSNSTIEGKKSKIISSLPIIFNGSDLSDIYINNLFLESTVDVSDTPNMSEIEEDVRGYLLTDSIIKITDSENVKIENCDIKGSFCGININTSTKVNINNNNIYNASHICLCLSTSEFICNSNYIHDVNLIESVDGYANYLFQATDNLNGDQSYSIFSNNKLENNIMWDAVMCHRISNIIFSNNIIKNVRNGFDLTVLDDEYPNKNIIIESNIIEGCSTNKWVTSALNHGIIVKGSSDNLIEDIKISNNIIKNFGIYSSPSGQGLVHIQNVKNGNVNNNNLTYNSSVTSDYKGCIVVSQNVNNINIDNNNIISNVQAILFNNPTGDNINISNNVVKGDSTMLLRAYGNTVVTNLILDNNSELQYNDYIHQGAKINNTTYSALKNNTFYKRKRMKISYTDSARTVNANSYATFTVSLPEAIQNTANIEINRANGSLSEGVIVVGGYATTTSLKCILYNLTGNNISLPESTYTIKIDN